jgi:hypothetical protein
MNRRHLNVFIVLAGILLVMRWGLCFSSPQFKYADEQWFMEIAQNLVDDRGYRIDHEGRGTLAICHAPGLPFSLALAGYIMPLTPLTTKLINATISWVAILGYALAAYWLTRNLFVAMTVMVFIGLHPPFAYLSASNYPNTFEAFWLAALVLLIVRGIVFHPDTRITARWGLAEGFLVGIGALYVPPHLFVLPALALAQFTRHFRRWLVYCIALGFGFVLSLVPWTVRNFIHEKAFIPFSISGGLHMYLGFNSQAGANTASFIDTSDLLAKLVNVRTPKEVEDVAKAEAVAWIKAHPADAARLWLAKTLNFFRWDNGRMATASEGDKLTEILLCRATTLLVYAVFLFGCLRGFSKGRFWVVFGSLTLLLQAAGYGFFCSRYRYRLPFEPLLLFIGLTLLLSHPCTFRRGPSEKTAQDT